MKKAFITLLLICLSGRAIADGNPIGFQSSTLPDAHNERALEMVVWYPSATSAKPQLIADSPVFVGALAVRNAPAAAGEHPFALRATE